MINAEYHRNWRRNNRAKCCQYAKKWKLSHPPTAEQKEKNRAYAKAYKSANPEKIKEANRKWRMENREHLSAEKRKWAIANRGKARESTKRWGRANPARLLAYAKTHIARRKDATIGCRDSIMRIYERCQELKQWFRVSVDHIIPLSKGGAHSVDNLQIIYESENNRKNAKLNYQPTVIFI